MIKLQTGISTNMDFIKAMKERGQDVNAEFPAETLRNQFDELSEETKVTFESTNETILKVVNEGEEPTTKVEVTFDVTGLEEGDEPHITVGEEIITEVPTILKENEGTELSYSVTCEGYEDAEGTITFDEDKEVTVTMEKTPVEDVTVTFTVDGLDEGDNAYGAIGNEAIQSFPAEITREKGTTETLEVTCEGYVTETQEVTFDEDKTVNVTLEKEPSVIEFRSAERMDVSGATPQDNPGIVENGDKYEVVKDGNTILVTDEGLIPYVGGNIDEPKKWVGILVDLGVKVQGTEYNIEEVDYTEAARWGAENDTTFLMWLTTEKGGNYTFTNVDNDEDTIILTVDFE